MDTYEIKAIQFGLGGQSDEWNTALIGTEKSLNCDVLTFVLC